MLFWWHQVNFILTFKFTSKYVLNLLNNSRLYKKQIKTHFNIIIAIRCTLEIWIYRILSDVKINELAMGLPEKLSFFLFIWNTVHIYLDPAMLLMLDTHNWLLNRNRIQIAHFGSVNLDNFIVIVFNIIE